MNGLGASILIVIVLIILVAPRRWALLGMMASVLYLTQYQQIEVAGFNMFMHRFIELAAFIRVVTRRELSLSKLNRIDWGLIVLYAYTTVVYLSRESESAAYIIGQAVDAYLCYFAFRCLVTNLGEFRWFLKAFVFLLAPYMLLLVREHFTGHNPFAVLGAIPDDVTRDDGSFRAAGS